MANGHVIMIVEPSKRLSEILGFPYFIEKSFPVSEMLEKGVITLDELERMKQGEEICKKMNIV